MLDPATVVLAVPRYEQKQRVRASLVPQPASVVTGSAIEVGLVIGLNGLATAALVPCLIKFM